MANKDELIAQFIEISGGDENVARFYLASSNWNLENALSNFLGSQMDDNKEGEGEACAASASQTAAESSVKCDDNFRGGGSTGRPRFATLRDVTKKADDEEGQAFYAGGSERSGQQVLGPPKRKSFREHLSEMFRMAHEESIPESPQASTSTTGNWGEGVRLGMTDTDHVVVKPPSKDAGQEKRPVVVLKLWNLGFSVNDGELRPYDDPNNKEFLETVMRGEVPNELLEMGWMVNVDVEDHRQEDYKKKQGPLHNFKGSGYTLGSPTPDVEKSGASGSSSMECAKSDDNRARGDVQVDTSLPTTSLQIRLSDGSRLAAQFNLTHTVRDIHQYIDNARPHYENQNYILVSSFPTRELTDLSVTIESAGLKNAAIMQRLK